MVDSIKPTIPALKTRSVSRRNGQAVQNVESHGDEKPHLSKAWNKIERRSGKDRRHNQASKREHYEMRQKPRGRRLSDHTRVQTKA